MNQIVGQHPKLAPFGQVPPLASELALQFPSGVCKQMPESPVSTLLWASWTRTTISDFSCQLRGRASGASSECPDPVEQQISLTRRTSYWTWPDTGIQLAPTRRHLWPERKKGSEITETGSVILSPSRFLHTHFNQKQEILQW